MDFFKKVIGGVGSSIGATGAAPGFPYALGELLAKPETDPEVTMGIWHIYHGHHISTVN